MFFLFFLFFFVFLRFDLLVFWGCIIVLHFFTNKLIFKFIGFWLSGEHKGNESARMSLVRIFSPILDSFFLASAKCPYGRFGPIQELVQQSAIEKQSIG